MDFNISRHFKLNEVLNEKRWMTRGASIAILVENDWHDAKQEEPTIFTVRGMRMNSIEDERNAETSIRGNRESGLVR
jgi:hypothetical protein